MITLIGNYLTSEWFLKIFNEANTEKITLKCSMSLAFHSLRAEDVRLCDLFVRLVYS